MNAIDPGTPVRVITEGEVLSVDAEAGTLVIRRADGGQFVIADPLSQVVPVDPERPTLDRDAIARVLKDTRIKWAGPSMAEFRDDPPTGKDLAQAEAILALIEAAHPGLIR